jgi:serine/threonine protein kinase
MDETDLSIDAVQGQIVDGFEILEKFSNGAFSSVHFARHQLTGFFCAVKIIDLGVQVDKGLTDIMREISVFMQVSHPNIGSLFRLSILGHLLFFFMEYSEHGTLLQYVNKSAGLPEPEVNRLFAQIFSAVRHVHVQHFLAHRDLKLENILLDAQNNVKLIDFGLAGTFYRNVLKSFAGTNGYTAPEVLAGNEYNEACDIWSLGICLHVMLTGYLPFRTESREYQAVVEQALKFKTPGFLSPSVTDLLRRMLQPRPDRRITTGEMQSHPWLKPVVPLVGNIAPRPIVFYKVKGFKDILKFKRNPIKDPNPEFVRQAAELNQTDEEKVAAALQSGSINELTTTYFMLPNPITEHPLPAAKAWLPKGRVPNAGKKIVEPVSRQSMAGPAPVRARNRSLGCSPARQGIPPSTSTPNLRTGTKL